MVFWLLDGTLWSISSDECHQRPHYELKEMESLSHIIQNRHKMVRESQFSLSVIACLYFICKALFWLVNFLAKSVFMSLNMKQHNKLVRVTCALIWSQTSVLYLKKLIQFLDVWMNIWCLSCKLENCFASLVLIFCPNEFSLSLWQLVELLDSPLHNYFKQNDCLNYFFCFRWILIQFKR